MTKGNVQVDFVTNTARSHSSRQGSILQEADRLVSADRQNDYGHPIDDFSRTAALWTVILGIEIKPEQIPLCMIAVKISREINSHKRDTLIDIAGYAKTKQMIHEVRGE